MVAERQAKALSEKGAKDNGGTLLEGCWLMPSGKSLKAAVEVDEKLGGREVGKGRNGLVDKRGGMEEVVGRRRIDLHSRVEAARRSDGGGMVATRAKNWQDVR